MWRLIPSAVACVFAVSGPFTQDKQPAFETGNQVNSKLLAEQRTTVEKETEARDQVAKLRLNEWKAGRFWFVPNKKRAIQLRFGFASELQENALREGALLFPTGIVSFKVLSREKYDGSDYLKVQFEGGPEAYLLERDFSRKLSEVTPDSLPKRLTGDEISNLKSVMSGNDGAAEEFFATDPIRLTESFDQAWKKQADTERAKSAKRKQGTRSEPTRGVEIRLSRGVVRAGITSDEFVAIVPASAVIDKRVTPDMAIPGSLKVWTDCRIEGREFTVLFARLSDPGPYILVSVIPK